MLRPRGGARAPRRLLRPSSPPLLLLVCVVAAALARRGVVAGADAAAQSAAAGGSAEKFHADASVAFFRNKALLEEGRLAAKAVVSSEAANVNSTGVVIRNEAALENISNNDGSVRETDSREAAADKAAAEREAAEVALGLPATDDDAQNSSLVGKIVGESAFSAAIEGTDLAFIKFFSPRCPHCRVMAPAYVSAARQSNASGLPIQFFEADCTLGSNAVICDANVPAGYPTLKLFSKGVALGDYIGVRDEQAMKHWLEHAVEFRNTPRVVHLASKRELAVFLNRSGDWPVALAVVNGETPTYLRDEWLETVDVMRDGSAKTVFFATVPDWTYLAGEPGSRLRSKYEETNVFNTRPFALAGPFGAALGENGTEPHWWYDGVAGSDSLETFMHISTILRTRAVMTATNARYISSTSRPLAILFGRAAGPGWYAEKALEVLSEEQGILPIYASSIVLSELRRHVGFSPLEPVSTLADYEQIDYVLFRAPNSGVERVRRKNTQRPSRKAMLRMARTYLKWGVNMTERRSAVQSPTNDGSLVGGNRTISTPREVVSSSWFQIFERDGRAMLLWLYRDGCKKCESEKPVFEKACKLLAADARSVFCARMDFGLNDLPPYLSRPDRAPTVYALVPGEVATLYSGAMTSLELASFGRLAAMPAHLRVESTVSTHPAVLRFRSTFASVLWFLGSVVTVVGVIMVLSGTRAHAHSQGFGWRSPGSNTEPLLSQTLLSPNDVHIPLKVL